VSANCSGKYLSIECTERRRPENENPKRFGGGETENSNGGKFSKSLQLQLLLLLLLLLVVCWKIAGSEKYLGEN